CSSGSWRWRVRSLASLIIRQQHAYRFRSLGGDEYDRRFILTVYNSRVRVKEAEPLALVVAKAVGHTPQRIGGKTVFARLAEFLEALARNRRNRDNRRSSACTALGF